MAANARPFNQNESFADSWMPGSEYEAEFRDCFIQRDLKGCFSTGRPRLMLQAVDAEGAVHSRRFAMELDNKFKPGEKRLFVSRTELASQDRKPALFTPGRAPPPRQQVSGLDDVYAA